MKFLIYTAIFLLISLTGCQSSNEIYIERHAEKSTEPANDPHLTGEGKARAESLKNILKDKNIKVIFSTERIRTVETATPLKQLTNIPIQYYGNDTLAAFMQRVVNLKKNVLIVGHSNTLLPILDALGQSHTTILIPDNDYDNIFIIKTKGGKAVKTIETTYREMSR